MKSHSRKWKNRNSNPGSLTLGILSPKDFYTYYLRFYLFHVIYHIVNKNILTQLFTVNFLNDGT